MNRIRPLHKIAAAVAVLAALALGVLAGNRWQAARTPVLEAGVLLSEPRPVAEFRLTDGNGQPFDRQRLLGGWNLVFVGFTHCPDVCPTTLAVLGQVQRELERSRRPLRAVFVSVDPERDTPERLGAYLGHFGPALQGASGAPDELARLCASLGVAYVRNPGARDDEYTFDHTAALVLVDPQARVAGYFQAPHKAATLAADLARLIPST